MYTYIYIYIITLANPLFCIRVLARSRTLARSFARTRVVSRVFSFAGRCDRVALGGMARALQVLCVAAAVGSKYLGRCVRWLFAAPSCCLFWPPQGGQNKNMFVYMYTKNMSVYVYTYIRVCTYNYVYLFMCVSIYRI